MAWRPIREYEAANRYPNNENQLRHIYRNRHENGLAPAFAQVGNRVLFDPERLDELLTARAAQSAERAA